MYQVNEFWYSPEPPDGFFSQRLEPRIDVHYQQRYRAWVYQHIPQRRVMIDVGANIGIFARPSASVFEKVICFEPVALNYQVLEKNLADCDNVELHALGLGNHACTVKFELQINKCGCSHQVDQWRNDPDFAEFECELVTLDSFQFQAVDWIKIDVEGAEMAVLEGGVHTVRHNRPWLLIERNGQENQHQQWLNDCCGSYVSADIKSKTNTLWIPQ
jgi:FkbM family methyltransferase